MKWNVNISCFYYLSESSNLAKRSVCSFRGITWDNSISIQFYFISFYFKERHSHGEVTEPRALNTSPADHQQGPESAPICASHEPIARYDRGRETTASNVSNLELLQAMGQVERNLMSYVHDSLKGVAKIDLFSE